MKALVYQGPGQKAWTEKPKPALQQPTDVIVKVTKTTICGTDLHILKGDVPAVTPGRILGHEGVGVVEAVGPAVQNFKPGDAVLVPPMEKHQYRNRGSGVFRFICCIPLGKK